MVLQMIRLRVISLFKVPDLLLLLYNVGAACILLPVAQIYAEALLL